MKVNIKLLNGGKLPEFKTKGAACADCYSRMDKSKWVWLKPVLIPLSFAMELEVKNVLSVEDYRRNEWAEYHIQCKNLYGNRHTSRPTSTEKTELLQSKRFEKFPV